MRGCIALSRGEPRVAIEILADVPLDNLRSDLVGEALAARAFAEACDGDGRTSKETMTAVERLGGDVTSQVFGAATESILALNVDDLAATARLDVLTNVVITTGCVDTLVCALRAQPALLAASTQHASMREIVRIAATRSGDPTLASSLGEVMSPSARRWAHFQAASARFFNSLPRASITMKSVAACTSVRRP